MEEHAFHAVSHAHALLREHLQPGAWALDATAGNGHDTLCLARLTGPSGKVFAIDIQRAALERTEGRVNGTNIAPVHLIRGDHASLQTLLPAEAIGRLEVAVFNLGYLPQGNKAVITRPRSTRLALRQAFDALKTGGLLLVTGYLGHSGGTEEWEAVIQWSADSAVKRSKTWRSSAQSGPRQLAAWK